MLSFKITRYWVQVPRHCQQGLYGASVRTQPVPAAPTTHHRVQLSPPAKLVRPWGDVCKKGQKTPHRQWGMRKKGERNSPAGWAQEKKERRKCSRHRVGIPKRTAAMEDLHRSRGKIWEEWSGRKKNTTSRPQPPCRSPFCNGGDRAYLLQKQGGGEVSVEPEKMERCVFPNSFNACSLVLLFPNIQISN